VEARDLAASTDAVEIYASFLDGWAGKEKDPINVASRLEALSSNDLKKFSNCAYEDGKLRELSVESVDDLTSSLGKLSYVHLVDPRKWKPRDPGDLISRGKTIESAVGEGIASGLLTFSAIAFDPSRETAMFTYSFVCGALCGNGGTIKFKKVRGKWVQAENRCERWVSHARITRSTISSQPVTAV
ncbi:MAG TPA: hypothetical protein VKM35_04695, partial [Arenimonas sp.]|uniref:hypothetical protein n=1 Tax=Arenimonas sp. TaxID=1872635 RepID=UPI002C4DE38C